MQEEVKQNNNNNLFHFLIHPSKKMQQERLLLSFFFIGFAFADFLQNSDFETPPLNLPAGNGNVQFQELNQNSTIPGWSFEGSVVYVTAGGNVSLPGGNGGHAIQLSQDGKINQTFMANGSDYLHYLLTFTLATGGQNCSSYAGVSVSAPDSNAVFTVKQNYGKEDWESYGVYLGSWDTEEINLVIQSQAAESDDNSTCWPLIDKLLIKTIGDLAQDKGNLILNGGLEFGPEFLPNSAEGVLIDSSPSPLQSPLRQWSVTGTVKYIDSKNYFVPQGNAAIEIISGVSAGIQTAATLAEGSAYSLEFILGDANDSCEGNFLVGAQAGATGKNYTLQSNGTGSAKKFSLEFKADATTTISFISYSTMQTKEGVFCGPVVDDVLLRASSGVKSGKNWGVFMSFLFLAVIL